MKSTIEFHYMYRDGDNNKDNNILSFANPESSRMLLDEARRRLTAAFDEGTYFIAAQIGVPSVFLWSPEANYDPEDSSTFPKDLGPGKYVISDSDHCWHEFDDVRWTEMPPCDTRTIRQFVEEVEAASKRGWAEFEPASIRKVV